MTGFVPVMWAVWGLLVVVMLALKIYTGRLSRNEENQLILDPAFENLKTEQAAIAESVHKIEPLRRASLWLLVAGTIFVVGYYAVDVFTQFK